MSCDAGLGTVTNALGAGATTVSSLTTSGDLLMTEDAAVLTHSAASGTSLAISSTNGYVSIGGSYVDVESVRITDAKIGLSSDADLITLTSGVATVAGKVHTTTLETTGAATLDSATVTNALGAGATTVSSLTTSGDLLMTEDAAVLTHSAASGTSLAISSTNGYVSIGGSYVDVESVRITDAKIGVSGDPDLITLTSGDVAVAGTLSTTGAATLNSATVTNALGAGATSVTTLTTSGAATLASATVTGSLGVGGATGDATKKLYVTGDTETTGDLAIGGDATFAGTVTVTGTFTALGDYRIGDSAPSDSLTVNAETNHTGPTTMSDTLDVVGATTLESSLALSADSAAITHSGSTSLAISSTNGYVSIAGATGSYVDVESVRITDAKIGVSGDPDLITLTSGDVAVTGTLSTTGAATLNSATVTNALGAGATSVTTLTTSGAATTTRLGDGDECAGGRGDDREQPDDVGRPADDGGCGGADALGGLGDVAGDLQHERVRVHCWIVRGRGVGAHHGREDRGER